MKRIFVFYGGIDLTDETSKALKALVKISSKNIQADVIVGSKNPQKFEIEKFCRQYDFLHYHEQINNLAELMSLADLSIGAGGTTTWERCFLGLPAIVTAVAENQIKGCQDLDKAGFIKYLGQSAEVTPEKIVNAIESLTPEILLDMQEKSLKIFCGRD